MRHETTPSRTAAPHDCETISGVKPDNALYTRPEILLSCALCNGWHNRVGPEVRIPFLRPLPSVSPCDANVRRGFHSLSDGAWLGIHRVKCAVPLCYVLGASLYGFYGYEFR